MFRANIYNLEPFDKPTRESINTGIEMVAAYMGHAVVAKECRLKMSTDPLGRVNPMRVGFGKMDTLTELHLLAVPLSLDFSHERTVGLAGVGRGFAFVDTEPELHNTESGLRTITAHEVAHALGFLRQDSHHAMPSDGAHCGDADCILHSHVSARFLLDQKHPGETRTTSFKRVARHMLNLATTKPVVGYQYDFCLPCKVDIREHGDSNLNQLRVNRAILKKPIA
jgi:hypothetical protein